MFKITNLEEINKKYSRELGNEFIIEISDFIKDNISNQYVFVRYMGPKFVIVFSGVEVNGVAEFINDLKERIEKHPITLPEEDEENEEEQQAYPRLNFVISTYYKGTGLEEILKKLEEYLDNADEKESNITNI